MSAPAAAIFQEVVWKNDEVLGFAVSLVKHALAKLNVGATTFSTDIVPDVERGSGKGIAGSVVALLITANLVELVGVIQNKIFYAQRVKSKRPESKARWLNLYRLKSRALAEEFLRRYEALVPKKETQPELAATNCL
jgi:hypothetical protein